MFEADVSSGEHPLVLAQNEGFSITVPAVPATGTWTLAVNVRWAEVTDYPYY